MIPALTIEVESEVYVTPPTNQINEIGISESLVNEFDPEVNFNESSFLDSFQFDDILIVIYLFVTTILFLKLLIGIFKILCTAKKYDKGDNIEYIIVPSDNSFKNSSFYKYLFIDGSLDFQAKQQVIKHEQVHIQNFHFIDKLVVNASVCILWFNPFAYAFLNAIDANHEFEADSKSATTINKNAYADLILNLSQNNNQLIINHFSKLPLKKRMIMLFKTPTNRMKKIAYLIILPLIALCCLAFVNQKEVMIYINSSAATTPNEKIEKNEISVLKAVEKNTQINKEIIEEQPENSRITEVSNLQEKVNSSSPISTVIYENPFEKSRTTILGVLVIDAGHGGKDNASKSITGIEEKEMNLRVALILKEEAEKRNIKVVMTRNKDEFVSLSGRVAYQTGADAFISIHHNTMPQEKDGSAVSTKGFKGVEVYYTKDSKIKRSKDLGLNILKSLKLLQDFPVRDSLKSQNLFVTREAMVPSIVVEMANMSYQDSFDFVNDEKNIRRICNLILDGYAAFLGC